MYRVPTDLAYVHTEGGAIFLDIEGDRYFRLPAALEPAFAAATRDGAIATGEAERLFALGVLEAENDEKALAPRAPALAVKRSIVDPDAIGAVRFPTILAVTVSLLRARAKLKAGLARTLAAIAERPGRSLASRDMAVLRDASRAYLAARRFIPIEPVCLLDSVALLDFLGRRGLDADLVFGVIVRPFSAHCWLQVEDLALNDELDNLIGRAPILVV